MSTIFDMDPHASGSEPLYNVLTEKYELLYCLLTRGDADRIIDERQALPEQYPLWQGTLIVKRVMPQEEEMKYPSAARRKAWPDVLPEIPAGGARPTIFYGGGNLALGFDDVFITVECEGWRGDIRLEEALFNIDSFAAEGRERILACLPYQFEMAAMPIDSNDTEQQATTKVLRQ